MRPASDSVRRARPLLGTFVEIAASGVSRDGLHAAIDRAFETVAAVHHLMSFHERESDVSRLNREAAVRPIRVHPWTSEVLRWSDELFAASAGLFDIAIAGELQRLGLLPCVGDSLPPPTTRMRTANAPVELLPRHHVRFTRPDVRIDLGGIAKGFAVDRAVATLRACGVPQGLVNAGGDVAVFGPDVAPVHLRDPRHLDRTLLRVAIRDEAIASSGNVFDRSSGLSGMAMIIDPGTRRPATTIRGATVRAPLCVLADALTKLVLLAGQSADALLTKYGASALLVERTGDVLVTHNWAEEMRPAS
jgi:FAD:protein FMN transferase